MKRFLHIALAFAASLSSLVAISEARACVWVPLTVIGENGPLEGEALAKWNREQATKERKAARLRQKQFRNDVRNGAIDSAAGLSELLIPNVREWWEDRTDCGPDGDHDGPPMPVEAMVAEAFVGTELEGLEQEELLDYVPSRFARALRDTYARPCNTEFRARFSERLNAEVSLDDRNAAYLLLSKDGEYRWSYFRFTEARRSTRPELRSPNLQKAVSRSRLTPILDAFWDEAIPYLREASLICPTAHRELMASRAIELERLRQRSNYAAIRARAEIGRTKKAAEFE